MSISMNLMASLAMAIQCPTPARQDTTILLYEIQTVSIIGSGRMNLKSSYRTMKAARNLWESRELSGEQENVPAFLRQASLMLLNLWKKMVLVMMLVWQGP